MGNSSVSEANTGADTFKCKKELFKEEDFSKLVHFSPFTKQFGPIAPKQNGRIFEDSRQANARMANNNKKELFMGDLIPEGKIFGNPQKEFREKVTPKEYSHTECITQIFSKFVFAGDETRTCGTGTRISRIDSDKLFVLTCAHNVSHYDKLNEKLIGAESIEIHFYDPVKKKEEVISVKEIFVCPKYKENPGIFDGNDLAILLLEQKRDNDLRIGKDSCWDFYKAEDSSRSLKVMGFPGEAHLLGNAYEMTGKTHFVVKGRMIIYKDINTSGGQSGSPVLVHNPTQKGSNGEWRIVGIHVGSDLINKCNIGTLIDHEKFIWINSFF